MCYNYTLNIIVLVSSTTFQTYNITLCDASCDHDHVYFHCLRNKRNRKEKKKKIKSKKIDKKKRKSK